MSKVSLGNQEFDSLDENAAQDDLSVELADDVVFYAEAPTKSEVLEAHQELDEESPAVIHVVDADSMPEGDIQVSDEGDEGDGAHEIILSIEIPGADDLDPEKEKLLQITEEDLVEKTKDTTDKWNWSQSHGLEKFVDWAQEMYKNVPKHSGYSVPGLQRAVAYVEKLLDEVSRAMRSDINGVLDANTIEDVRTEIDKGFDLLQDRIEKLNKSKKKKKSSFAPKIIKEAQKTVGISGIYVTVPLLISRVARVCINGMVSSGRDIEDLFHRQIKKYNLNTREQAEVMQCLADMGYALRSDRGYFLDDPEDDGTGENGYDFTENYPA